MLQNTNLWISSSFSRRYYISGWHEEYPDVPLFEPSEILNDLVARNKLGRKTGEGFYKYE